MGSFSSSLSYKQNLRGLEEKGGNMGPNSFFSGLNEEMATHFSVAQGTLSAHVDLLNAPL